MNRTGNPCDHPDLNGTDTPNLWHCTQCKQTVRECRHPDQPSWVTYSVVTAGETP